MSRFIYGRTTHCCRCYAIATNWNGWLIKSRDGILAGFCQVHRPHEEPKTTFDKKNLRGIYSKQMGETEKVLDSGSVIEKYGLDKNIIEQ